MKRLIVSNTKGEILATAPHPADQVETQDKKSGFGFLPLKGQQVHEVELPAYVKTMDHIVELHKTHLVLVESGVAKLKMK
jgi:hypothetical protein